MKYYSIEPSTTMAFNELWLQSIHKYCLLPQNQRILISSAVSRNLHNTTSRRKAAVLIPLCNRHGKASLLFTKRSDKVGTHKGQVSFPGGHLDANETAIDAAIRETYEELGGNIGKISVLGTCQTVPAITGTLVTPIIGYFHDDVRDFENFSPNEEEVSLTFTRSVDELIEENYKTYEILSRQGQEVKMPIFGPKGDPCRIWGLTAMILDGVLDRVILPHRS